MAEIEPNLPEGNEQNESNVSARISRVVSMVGEKAKAAIGFGEDFFGKNGEEARKAAVAKANEAAEGAWNTIIDPIARSEIVRQVRENCRRMQEVIREKIVWAWQNKPRILEPKNLALYGGAAFAGWHGIEITEWATQVLSYVYPIDMDHTYIDPQLRTMLIGVIGAELFLIFRHKNRQTDEYRDAKVNTSTWSDAMIQTLDQLEEEGAISPVQSYEVQHYAHLLLLTLDNYEENRGDTITDFLRNGGSDDPEFQVADEHIRKFVVDLCEEQNIKLGNLSDKQRGYLCQRLVHEISRKMLALTDGQTPMNDRRDSFGIDEINTQVNNIDSRIMNNLNSAQMVCAVISGIAVMLSFRLNVDIEAHRDLIVRMLSTAFAYNLAMMKDYDISPVGRMFNANAPTFDPLAEGQTRLIESKLRLKAKKDLDRENGRSKLILGPNGDLHSNVDVEITGVAAFRVTVNADDQAVVEESDIDKIS